MTITVSMFHTNCFTLIAQKSQKKHKLFVYSKMCCLLKCLVLFQSVSLYLFNLLIFNILVESAVSKCFIFSETPNNCSLEYKIKSPPRLKADFLLN